jgi:hypothetical protein
VRRVPPLESKLHICIPLPHLPRALLDKRAQGRGRATPARPRGGRCALAAAN